MNQFHRSQPMVLLSLTSMPVMNLLATMVVEFTVAAQKLRSTMLCWLLAMVLKMDKTTGWSRTLGVQTGAKMVWSRWLEEETCAELANTAMLLSVRRPLESSPIPQWPLPQSPFHPSRNAISPRLTLTLMDNTPWDLAVSIWPNKNLTFSASLLICWSSSNCC